MQNNKIIIAAAVGIVLVGIAAYLTLSGNNAYRGGMMSQTAGPSGSATMSLKDLLTKNESVRCTFSDELDGKKTSGTVYVASGKMRSDFVALQGSDTPDIISHMLMMDSMMRVWTSGSKQGIKIILENGNIPSGKTPGVDADKKVNYSCAPWFPDSTTFVVPNDVTFMESPVMMPAPGKKIEGQTAAPSNGDIEAPQCLACNTLPAGIERDQCRQRLGCT